MPPKALWQYFCLGFKISTDINNSVNVYRAFFQRFSILSSHYYFLSDIPEKVGGSGNDSPCFSLKQSPSLRGR